MKIIKIIGGLGNQMFQYAFYLAVKKACPSDKVLVDLHCFNGYKLHEGFELDKIFSKIDVQKAYFKDIIKVSYPYPNFITWKYGKHLLPKRKTMFIENKYLRFEENWKKTLGNNCYYDGYWQNENYFQDIKEQIKDVFTFPELDKKNQETASLICSHESISIHIRRGDYLTDPLFKETCQIEYYQKSISYAKKYINPELFCIFSNDTEWCKKVFSALLPKDKTIFITWNHGKNSFKDMQLMSLCKHNIIANSSFSWWGAWLNKNKNKVVIAPKTWYAKKYYQHPIPTTWIQL